MALSIRSYEGFREAAGVAFNNAHARVGGRVLGNVTGLRLFRVT